MIEGSLSRTMRGLTLDVMRSSLAIHLLLAGLIAIPSTATADIATADDASASDGSSDSSAAEREGRMRWSLRKEASTRALHSARRVLWLTTSLFYPVSDSPPPTSLPEPVLTNKPVPGELSSPFGYRRDPVRRRRRKHHKGVDFVAKRGSLVRASGPGIVVHASRRGGYGRMVVVDHGLGLETRYAHLRRIKVKKGEFVPAGAAIGTVGSSGRATGPHLHFEVRQDGVALPPQDVAEFELPVCARRARDCRRPPRNT